MIKEEFIKTYCLVCGTQLCTGPYDELSDGCEHYKREFLQNAKKQTKFITCHVCKGSGVYSQYEQCPICRGFGTVIIYEENEND